LKHKDPGVRQIVSLMGPAIIGTGAVQINVFVNTNFASAIIDPATGAVADGPVSWLNFAFRFMHFPIGVFGVAIATATLPPLSRSSARKDLAEFRETLANSLGLVFLLCVPSAAGLAVLGQPIVALIFEHGRFTAFDTLQTANALAAYSIGLAGYAAIKVLSPACYALGDARTPMLISLGSIAVNYVMNTLLVGPFGHVGLALSTSAVALVNFFLLAVVLRYKLARLGGRRLTRTFLRVCLASAAMAGAAWLVSAAISAQLALAGFALHLARVFCAIGVAAFVFYFACRLLKVTELDQAVEVITRPLLRALRKNYRK
jgi:putative peptidoglycan lipid II flippase